MLFGQQAVGQGSGGFVSVRGACGGKSKGGVKEASCARAPTDIKKKDKMTDFMYIFIAVTSYDKRRQR